MAPLDIIAIERQARQLRAEEIQRINGLVSARLQVYRRLLAAKLVAGLASVGKTLHSLFSSHPQARHSS